MSFLPFENDKMLWLRGHADHIITDLLVVLAVAAIGFLFLNPGTTPSIRAW